jgi:DNA repair exonuclease SbcCD nuclease subunit
MEEHRALSRMDECLAEKNCKMIAIRGNHDKPSHFGANEYNLDNITFLPDYTYININGKRYLFVGGATSVDRLARKEGVDYWKSEKVTYLSDDDFNKLSPADVLILHSAPDFCYPRGYDHPFVLAYGRHDKTLIDELKVERQYLAKLVDYVKPKEVFYGHFHNCNREESNRGYVCKYTLLNINQMVKYEPAN